MKIAIIGAGISGLGAAYALSGKHDVHLFEKNAYLGGHARTIDIQIDGKTTDVDTGFIVFNKKNYPHLTALFEHLDVDIAKSAMSFGASVNGGYLEYGSDHLFAQKRNIFKPKFWRLIWDILKFNRTAKQLLETNQKISLGEYLDREGFSTWFRKYYLEAMGAAIWSSPAKTILSYPAETFIRFFDNHGLLTVNDQPQWYTVKGGSQVYVQNIIQKTDCKIHTNAAIKSVVRDSEGVILTGVSGEKQYFDRVIFACHADTALALLQDPTVEEKNALSAFRYQKNTIVVHADETFMPKHRKAWSSWVYLSEGDEESISLTYWMNNLQPLQCARPVLITLNPGRMPIESCIYDRHDFDHPIFDRKAVEAQRQIAELQGQKNTWFCGAHLGYGFHEDGLKSAADVVLHMGEKLPWM